MQYLGMISHPQVCNGEPLPYFDAGGFINTLEGWNLNVKCHEAGDMQPYNKARDAYNRKYGIEPCPEWEEFIKGAPSVGEVFRQMRTEATS